MTLTKTRVRESRSQKAAPLALRQAFPRRCMRSGTTLLSCDNHRDFKQHVARAPKALL
jgi:hypothetical protein